MTKIGRLMESDNDALVLQEGINDLQELSNDGLMRIIVNE